MEKLKKYMLYKWICFYLSTLREEEARDRILPMIIRAEKPAETEYPNARTSVLKQSFNPDNCHWGKADAIGKKVRTRKIPDKKLLQHRMYLRLVVNIENGP